MMLLEFLRKVIFWVFDFLRGGEIRKHYNDIKYIQENHSTKKSREKRTGYLNSILTHAIDNVPFYKFLNRNQNITLEDFPVIDKLKIRENFELFKSKNYLSKKKHAVVTSGSTGNPFKIYQDLNKRNRNTADTIYFTKKAGFEIGSRLYYFRLWDKQYKKDTLTSFKQNVVMHSVDDFSKEYLVKIIEQIKSDSSSKGILGYVSALQSICKYLDSVNSEPLLNCKVKSIISIAESLNDYTRTTLSKYFGVKVISRYSNSENGIIAQQSLFRNDDNFDLNWASYHVEILAMNEDRPVEKGETGRIVITDLFNYAMPLIRYDTGDVVKAYYPEEESSLQPMVLTKVEGRKMDMFTNTKGEFISPHIIHQVLQYKEIDQFQFIQDGFTDYKIKLKLFKEYNYVNEEKLVAQYKTYFGDDATIVIDYVKDIPLLLSGKRKLVINNAIAKQNNTRDGELGQKELNAHQML